MAAAGFSIGTKGYIGMGIDAEGSVKNDFWEWDGNIASPTYNTWTPKANFGGVARYSAIGFSIADKGYVGVGRDGALVYKQDFWEWNQATDTWIQRADYAQGLTSSASGFAGFALGDKGYVGLGGSSPSTFYQSFWEYTPVPAGTDCSSAITLTPDTVCVPQTFQITGTEMWFSFTADTQSVRYLVNSGNLPSNTIFDTIELYSGSCA